MPPLEGFDFSALDDPEFKEDSVREDLVAPILKALGYSPTGPHQMVRSRKLQHPYVSIGTTSQRISLIPDYLLQLEGRPAWILDAKSPTESVFEATHIAQAYSYAIHRDIRVDWFALCNGREIAAFHVADMASVPRLHFPLADLKSHWPELHAAFSPASMLKARTHGLAERYYKDLGIHLWKLGVRDATFLHFLFVPVAKVGRVNRELYTLVTTTSFDDQRYATSFDFDEKLLSNLLTALSPSVAENVRQRMKNFPTLIILETPREINIKSKLSGQIQENEQEHFMPLTVLDFFS
jgi:hypothetical protein